MIIMLNAYRITCTYAYRQLLDVSNSLNRRYMSYVCTYCTTSRTCAYYRLQIPYVYTNCMHVGTKKKSQSCTFKQQNVFQKKQDSGALKTE